tara:strand:+ start:154 stop:741 length:588 start_codon:yes stop_codon:yes gene_type:complete
MKNNEILEIYKSEKALLDGHFILSSGKHSSVYLQSAIVLSNPKYLNKIANDMVVNIKKIINIEKIDLVVSPAMGGIIIACKVGEIINKNSIFLERVNKKFTLRRGFEIKRNQNILLIEDVLTTGKSSFESTECINSFGGNVLCLSTIIDRSSSNIKFKFPFTSLLKIDAPIFSDDNIPLELSKIPAVKPGSRFIK